jgi:putative phosphoesterase
MNRFGLIGDVHAEDELLEAALRALATERVDRVLCVGDLADGQGDLDRCVALLQEHKVVTVRGNHDRWLLGDKMRELEHTHLLSELPPATREFVATLPATLRLETDSGPMVLCHGFGNNDMLETRSVRAIEYELAGNGYSKHESLARLGIDPDVRLIVAGHTHARMASEVDQFFIANPGTLRRSDLPGFAVLDVSGKPRVEFFDLDDGGQVTRAAYV